MAMSRIFLGFRRNWFFIDPLHYLSSRSDFGFEYEEIFVIEHDSLTLPLAEFSFKHSKAESRLSDSPRVGF